MIPLLPSHVNFKVLVIGAGPSGVAAIGKLMDLGVHPVLWVDQSFTYGRLGAYRQVPSNTKVSLFIKYAKYFESFRKVWAAHPDFQSLRELEALDENRGCQLAFAADMIKDISSGLRNLYGGKELYCLKGMVIESINGDRNDGGGNSWNVKIFPESFNEPFMVTAERVIMATGSHPKPFNNSCNSSAVQSIPTIDLDDALNSHYLTTKIGQNDIVGVVGSSHSAMLLLKMLIDLKAKPSQVFNFYRTPLKYAEYLEDGRIKHDNTGLKGDVAEWARKNLEECPDGNDSIECMNGLLKRIPLRSRAEEYTVYNRLGSQLTFLVSAIGYERNPLPKITFNNQVIPTEAVNYSSTGLLIHEGMVLEGLQGIGIAFPERVFDVDGVTPELAVGFWKFIQYIDRSIKVY